MANLKEKIKGWFYYLFDGSSGGTGRFFCFHDWKHHKDFPPPGYESKRGFLDIYFCKKCRMTVMGGSWISIGPKIVTSGPDAKNKVKQSQ